MSHDQEEFGFEHPFNALPPAVVAIVMLLGGIELVFQVGNLGLVGGPEAVGWRLDALQKFSFLDQVFEQMRMLDMWPFEHVRRVFTYAFVHFSITHVLMASVFILAMGKMVGEVFGNFAVLAIFVVSTIVGALAYGLILDVERPLAGAYPAAYGFIGAYSFILWIGLGNLGQNRLGAFRLIALLMGIQFVFGVLFGGSPDWVADLAGFAAGFATAAGLRPGAFVRLLARLRER
ncbi:rhomboid family intramembrane serine protease [Celeribacter litoreus]|uniref:rhomboid family intramembrane serine protease n=1 Tax=Celeribacter litoreus TaxID=2876714 RepID=UPI001CCFD92E|nr:rhomboid family intramembrane serine protease [Celeribacter litoreus]MCA0042682.1 rhomboid family intramembrane serine protease [Celeribacter litoreus]